MTARKLVVDAEPLAVVTPDDWAREGQAAGTPFSAAHTFTQTGPFRPRNLPFREAASCWPAAAPRPASASRRYSSPAGSPRGVSAADPLPGSTVVTGRGRKWREGRVLA